MLWPEGEALVAGSLGVGQTTLAGQVIRAQLGIGSSEVLGLTVAETSGNILYLAMDGRHRSGGRCNGNTCRPTVKPYNAC